MLWYRRESARLAGDGRPRLPGRDNLNLVVPIVDGDDRPAKKKAVSNGSGLGGHAKAVHVGVRPHHLGGFF